MYLKGSDSASRTRTSKEVRIVQTPLICYSVHFCFSGAWNCVRYLVSERSDEINQCYDENYPIHQATLHDIKFLGKPYKTFAKILTIYYFSRVINTMWSDNYSADLNSANDSAPCFVVTRLKMSKILDDSWSVII